MHVKSSHPPLFASSTPLRVALIEDEPLVRDRLRALIAEDPDLFLAGECDNGKQAIRELPVLKPDLVFLDIKMPGANGFEILTQLPAGFCPAVIFVTAYDEYAVKAFEVEAYDYLLKPFDRQRFRQAVSRAKNRILKEKEEAFPDRIQFKNTEGIHWVDVEKVIWIDPEGNYVRLHTDNGIRTIRKTLSQLEKSLDPRVFVRIHRSAIVNRARIRSMKHLYQGDYELVMDDGKHLVSSKGYRGNVRGLLE